MSLWQNPVNRLDVNNDTLVTPVADVLPMINELNLRRLIDNAGRLPDPSQTPALFYDVNGDGFLTPAGDVLPVINFLNQSAAPESADSPSDVEPTSGEAPISFAGHTLLIEPDFARPSSNKYPTGLIARMGCYDWTGKIIRNYFQFNRYRREQESLLQLFYRQGPTA